MASHKTTTMAMTMSCNCFTGLILIGCSSSRPQTIETRQAGGFNSRRACAGDVPPLAQIDRTLGARCRNASDLVIGMRFAAIDDGDASRDAQARSAGFDHGERRCGVANPTRGLN